MRCIAMQLQLSEPSGTSNQLSRADVNTCRPSCLHICSQQWLPAERSCRAMTDVCQHAQTGLSPETLNSMQCNAMQRAAGNSRLTQRCY